MAKNQKNSEPDTDVFHDPPEAPVTTPPQATSPESLPEAQGSKPDISQQVLPEHPGPAPIPDAPPVAPNATEQSRPVSIASERPQVPPKDQHVAEPEHLGNGTSIVKHPIPDQAARDRSISQSRPQSLRDRAASIRAGLDAVEHQPDTNPILQTKAGVSEWSHQQVVTAKDPEIASEQASQHHVSPEDEWQAMPAYATHTVYDDWGKILAREEKELEAEDYAYGDLGGAGKGYTKVQLDEDAQSATSMDENTAYLFKSNKPGPGPLDNETAHQEEDDERDVLEQMQATKNLLTEGQRIAYVGLVRLSMIAMVTAVEAHDRHRNTKKSIDMAVEALKMWSQRTMSLVYTHMEIPAAEQIMIEQLALHGVIPSDLTPTLMQNARVKNPINEKQTQKQQTQDDELEDTDDHDPLGTASTTDLSVKQPQDLKGAEKLDIDLRWTVLCDLFLVLISSSNYDSRSRTLLEHVAAALSIPWVDICRFEKRITDAIEMQESEKSESWNEDEHMEKRRIANKKRRLMYMGLATVGGGLVIGLSAGVLAPVIGAGLAAGFTTIGVAGTGTFLGGAGAAALITSTGVITGGTVAVRASSRRMGSVKTFEYRPLYNNKRVNLIITLSGWMTGKVDDVRLPFSTIDPVMGDIYSVLWEPEMLQSMGQTINILATEALTQGLQQLLASTVLTALMGALQLPLILTKLSYFIDNPWSVSMARADQAGLILADSLIDRNLGVRPVTLVGFSIGARVIFACLRELAKRAAYGIVQNVYLFGSPVVVDRDEYVKIRTMVSGRFVNGYAKNDWILGYLFRATAGGISRVAGLAPVEIKHIEDIDVTALVPGHMAYRAAMPKLMQEVGWTVESLEFTEIEDPDPENHEQRQRELRNEIEEARRELEGKQPKKGFRGLFSRKKAPEKKVWEQYDDETADPSAAAKSPTVPSDPNGVLFDVDAIRAEVVELASHGIVVKELPSNLPPLKSSSAARSASEQRSPIKRHDPKLLHSQSYSGEDAQSRLNGQPNSPIKVGFEQRQSAVDSEERWPSPERPMSRPRDLNDYVSSLPDRSRTDPPDGEQRLDAPTVTGTAGSPGAALRLPSASPSMYGNAWADDDDEFGQGNKGTINMTFE